MSYQERLSWGWTSSQRKSEPHPYQALRRTNRRANGKGWTRTVTRSQTGTPGVFSRASISPVPPRWHLCLADLSSAQSRHFRSRRITSDNGSRRPLPIQADSTPRPGKPSQPVSNRETCLPTWPSAGLWPCPQIRGRCGIIGRGRKGWENLHGGEIGG